MAARALFLTLSILLAIAVAQAAIVDILSKNGLPIGLLPGTVTSYTLSESGEFEVQLEKPCYAKFEDQVYYEKSVKGKIKFGTITGLSGIQAKQLFLWLPVTGIHVDVPSSGYIYFEVGVLSKKLSLSYFESVPACNSREKKEKPELVDAQSFGTWLSKALSGELEVNDPIAPRKALAQ